METKDRILLSAQRLVQQRGFNGFSYADIADEVGIRKASLHHHFPAKTDLGLALIDSYTQQFNDELQKIDQTSATPLVKLQRYIQIYHSALEIGRMCMCGILASETMTLDVSLIPKLNQFFLRNREWLTVVLGDVKTQKLGTFKNTAEDQAQLVLSVLQGAALICRSTGDLAEFDRVTTMFLQDFTTGE